MTFLAALFHAQLKYPTKIFLLRGNHEDARLTRIYGFWSECKRRYSTKLWKSCCQVSCQCQDASWWHRRAPSECDLDTGCALTYADRRFSRRCQWRRLSMVRSSAATAELGQNSNPLRWCVLNLRASILLLTPCSSSARLILGISSKRSFKFQIDKIKRPLAVPTTGILADLLWADPNPTPGARGWQPSDRGISYMFGADELSKFLKYNNLELICRGHQVSLTRRRPKTSAVSA